MATTPGHPRKGDKLFAFFGGRASATAPPTPPTTPTLAKIVKPIQGIVHRLYPNPHRSSESALVTPSIAPSGPHVATSMPNPIMASQPVAAPERSQKPFTKSQSFEKDIVLLHASFILQKDAQLKDVILLILAIRDFDEEDRLAAVLEASARFVVQLASAMELHQAEAKRAMIDFRGTMEKLKAQMDGDIGELGIMVSDEIERIKPSFLCNVKAGLSEDLSDFVDVAIGSTITVLGILESASSLIPVPLVQPIVSQVLYMMKAVEQTRSNYDDMKEIAARAGEFAVSCAVACSGKPVDGSEGRRLSRFTKELKTIAEDCACLSRQGLFARYLRQEGHANDLRAIEKRLSHAITLFQNETQLNIKLDMDALKRTIDHVSLDGLPSHPPYRPHEYLERSRDDVIKSISDWINDAKEPVLWMHGAAGLGKSTVAQQLIHLLQDDKRLAGGILLTLAGKEHSSEIIRMIAKQLGAEHPRAVCDIAEAARMVNSAHSPLGNYLTSYIINPIRALKYPYPLVIVIDGLDEWPIRDSLLKELEHMPLLPPVKFILTSRFSHAIERALKDVVHHPHPLPLASPELIECYFHHHFDQQDIDWKGHKPNEQKIGKLASLADGLLIWAATVQSLMLNHPQGKLPHQVLENVIASGEGIASSDRLKQLYQEALEGLLVPKSGSEQEYMKEMAHKFLGGIMVIETPLSVPDFASLSKIPESTVQLIHNHLAALQLRSNPDSSQIDPAIQTFHASFLQFLQSSEGLEHSVPQPFYHINPINHHLALGKSCLHHLIRLLKSYRGQHCTASQLSGLDQYIVRYWPLHLSEGTDRTESLTDTSLAGLTPAEFYHWSTLFVSLVLPESSDEHMKFNSGTPLSEVLYDLAMLIKDRSPSMGMDFIYIFEICGRLKPGDIQTWITLGDVYDKVYKAEMDPCNLDQAILVFRKALEVLTESGIENTPKGVAAISNKEKVLRSIGNALSTRFQQFGRQAYLDEAILMHQEALELRPS
ncbi:hypothetical protein CVT26_010857, partial [Gymnopilus dilepis]